MGKIQHTVFFKFPGLLEGSETAAAVRVVAESFNTLPGVVAQFGPAGAKGKTKEELLAEVDWPDRSGGFTHCLLVIFDDVAAAKTYLHSDLHLKEWIGVVKDIFQGIVVLDTELAVALEPQDEKIVHFGAFKIPTLEKDSEPHAELLKLVGLFNEISGVAASFKPVGTDTMSKDELLAAVEWPDKTAEFSFLLTIVCDNTEALKSYLHSEAHDAWVSTIRPLFGGTPPPGLIFDAQLSIASGL